MRKVKIRRLRAKAGRARMAKLDQSQASEFGRRAAQARWSRVRASQSRESPQDVPQGPSEGPKESA